ncbi:hypothetical protein MPSEU_000109600 [Mayamaea pseudoterrestris]|nr:hypothetical protein MPSEU_000109600 [Mayamaea pseudoterrestris]
MPQLTVILVRNAESEDEASNNLDCSDVSVEADFAAYIQDQAADERGRDQNQKTLSVRVDPELTEYGFEQAQNAMTLVVKALASNAISSQRKVAVFCAPLRTCAATALMLSCADVPNVPSNVLSFRLSTFDAATAPAAIPIVVLNGLCNGDAQIQRLAGYRCVVDAGLLHCAAHKFNDGRPNAPMMKCFQRIKLKTAKRIDEWDEARDANGQKLHQVTAVQYLRMTNDDSNNPWSLAAMVPKCNLLIDMAEPKRYMLTPRKGVSNPKQHYKEWEQTAEPYLKQAVLAARRVGCDTIILVVPAAAMQSVVPELSGATPAPCCVASLVATVGDENADSIQWSVHKVANPIDSSNATSLIPRFTGSINSLVDPPEGQDPSTANPPGTNVWAQFPPPAPEVLPANYPNLPDFCAALEAPMPVLKSTAPQFSGKTKTKKKPSKV